MKSCFKLGTRFSIFLLIAVVSCSVSKVEICEMCGRKVCVCDGVETPPDTDDDGGTGIPAPMPTGSNFITLKNSKTYLPDGNEARLWGVNFQTVISWEYNGRLAAVGIPKSADALNAVAENCLDDLEMIGVNHLRSVLTPVDITDESGNLVTSSVYLDALDYMIAEAEKRNMYVSFAFLNHMSQGGPGQWITKDRSTWIQDPSVVECSKRYVRQLLNHVNKYNNKAYKDTECIAYWELINEPSMFSYDEVQSQPACKAEYNAWLTANGKTDNSDSYAEFRAYTVRDYINGMMRLLEEQGDNHLVSWSLNWDHYMRNNQDIFEGVAASDVDIVAFCNYPGQALVDQQYWNYEYNLTSTDFSTWFKNCRNEEIGYGWALTDAYASKAKIVYEFETFFNQSAYLYPVQATYFRSFGIQSASMWTYTFDEIAPYFGGSHYLNLRTTPAKMAAFLVAQQIFRNEPHLTDFSSNPNEQTGTNYAISKSRNGAVWSSADTFIHSCEIGDSWNPLPPAGTVKHIVGYKSSPLVSYTGTGLYFIDDEGESLRITLLPNVEVVGNIYRGATYGIEKTKLDYATKNTLTVHLPGWTDTPLTLYKIGEDGSEKSMGNMSNISNLKLSAGEYVVKRR